jgi:cell wall-associated NlpC family hydrolase
MWRLFILIICLILLACQSTARFRAQKPKSQTTLRSNTRTISQLDAYVKSWLGVPYKYGGTSKNGVDCSGFTSQVYLNVYAITVPRTSSEQYKQGRLVTRGNMRPGDLVFFSNVRRGKIDHVGVYLGEQRFAHATESSGVTISELSEDYYKQRYIGACRY